MTTLASTANTAFTSLHGGVATGNCGRYGAPMTTVNSVLTAIEINRPGLKVAKQHLLLFFALGHHLAQHDHELFSEPLYATHRSVTIEPVGDTPEALDAWQDDTVAYVTDRYGALSPADLRTLVQASTPWQLARKNVDDPRIEWAWLTDWFRRPDETNDPDDERPNRAETAAAAELWSAHHGN